MKASQWSQWNICVWDWMTESTRPLRQNFGEKNYSLYWFIGRHFRLADARYHSNSTDESKRWLLNGRKFKKRIFYLHLALTRKSLIQFTLSAQTRINNKSAEITHASGWSSMKVSIAKFTQPISDVIASWRNDLVYFHQKCMMTVSARNRRHKYLIRGR